MRTVDDIAVTKITKAKQELGPDVWLDDPSLGEIAPASEGHFDAGALVFRDAVDRTGWTKEQLKKNTEGPPCLADFVISIRAAGPANVKNGQKYFYQAHVTADDYHWVFRGQIPLYQNIAE